MLVAVIVLVHMLMLCVGAMTAFVTCNLLFPRAL